MQSLQMQSCVHDDGTIECALMPIEVPDPGADEVVVRVEAAPINPSDLALMFGPADVGEARQSERNGHPALILPLTAAAQTMLASRMGQWLAVGNEASGTVVKAGASEAAQALLGRRVGVFGGELFAEHRCVHIMQCMALPDGVTAEEGASCFVNPMTALGMVETMKMEGHSALVHVAAASNLGQMLNRICRDDGVPLVNIVRSGEQQAMLRDQGAQWVLDSSAPDFRDALAEAVAATGATLAFDPVGGGTLANEILIAMEKAAVKRMSVYSRYGSEEHKQVYIYGGLDLSPTTLTRSYGLCWGVGGWLLTPFMKRAGSERLGAMQARVVRELRTTFASHYSDTVSLSDSLTVDAASVYGRRATGKKCLIRAGG